MNRETVRQLLLLFLNMFKDMGYTSLAKVNDADMEIQISLEILISNLEMNEEGAMTFLDEILLRYTGDESRRALQELVEAVRDLNLGLGDDKVLGDPGIASAVREAEAVLGVRSDR
jgi:hypothetical protein